MKKTYNAKKLIKAIERQDVEFIKRAILEKRLGLSVNERALEIQRVAGDAAAFKYRQIMAKKNKK